MQIEDIGYTLHANIKYITIYNILYTEYMT